MLIIRVSDLCTINESDSTAVAFGFSLSIGPPAKKTKRARISGSGMEGGGGIMCIVMFVVLILRCS